MDIYQSAIRPILFSALKTDPEWLHQQTLRLLEWLGRTSDRPPSDWLQSQLQQTFCLQDSAIEQTLWGLKFPNPLGLAAGFDKDGVAANMWSSLGFGFAELGTVTFQAQPGNPPPRLFRLPEDEAALNRMGFNNYGAEALARRLKEELNVNRLHVKNSSLPFGNAYGEQLSNLQPLTFTIPLGINIGKSKVTPLEEAATDYLRSFRLLKELGDYFVVNVSSPNT
ncbi:MAG TPA: hypothetical protein V6D48_25510, partial [Oculatellaceae cyanobacterium]